VVALILLNSCCGKNSIQLHLVGNGLPLQFNLQSTGVFSTVFSFFCSGLLLSVLFSKVQYLATPSAYCPDIGCGSLTTKTLCKKFSIQLNILAD
jgi:hypothetical protein